MIFDEERAQCTDANYRRVEDENNADSVHKRVQDLAALRVGQT